MLAELGESRKSERDVEQDLPPASPLLALVNQVAVGCVSLFGQSVNFAQEIGDNFMAASPWSKCFHTNETIELNPWGIVVDAYAIQLCHNTHIDTY